MCARRLYCTHNSRVSTVHPPSQVPQVCNSCDQPHAAKWSPAVHSSHEVAQRQGVALLMSLQQLSSSTQGVKGCPEQALKITRSLRTSLSSSMTLSLMVELGCFLDGGFARIVELICLSSLAFSDALLVWHIWNAMLGCRSGCFAWMLGLDAWLG